MSLKNLIFEKNYEIPKEKRMNVANLIKTLRENKKMTLSQLAEESGLNIADVHKIEHGTKNKINPFQFQAIGKILEIDYKVFYKMVGFLDTDDFHNGSDLSANGNLMKTISIDGIAQQINRLNLSLTTDELKEMLETLTEFKRGDSVELMEFLRFIRYKKNQKK